MTEIDKDILERGEKAPECYEHFYKVFFNNWEKLRNKALESYKKAREGK